MIKIREFKGHSAFENNPINFRLYINILKYSR